MELSFCLRIEMLRKISFIFFVSIFTVSNICFHFSNGSIEGERFLHRHNRSAKYLPSKTKNEDKNNLNFESEEKFVTYVGAVLEYEPYDVYTDDGRGYAIMQKNAETILQYAEQAKNKYGVDILVAPEYGLQSIKIPSKRDLDKFLTYTQFVPDPALGIVPCYYETNASNIETLKTLSCGAIKNKMYLVINLSELYPCANETVADAPWPMHTGKQCPDIGYIFYNTEVVFDREGVVIARYRKINLFMESDFTNGPDNDDSAIFVSDFGVTFTLQVCFDILYQNPSHHNVLKYGIKDVIMSTAWVNFLPFYLADTLQSGWSYGLGVNLLVSGYHKPLKAKIGSGIYRYFKTDPPVYTFSANSGNVLLVSNVTTIASAKNTRSEMHELNPTQQPYWDSRNNRRTYNYMNFKSDQHFRSRSGNLNETFNKISVENLLVKEKNSKIKTSSININIHENLKDYTKVVIPNGKSSEVKYLKACDKDFCCSLEYKYSGKLTYMLMVLDGNVTVPFGQYAVRVQSCSVVWCRLTNYRTCGYILGRTPSDEFGPFKLKFSVSAYKSVYPSGNHRNMSLIDLNTLDFVKNGDDYTLSSQTPIKNPLTFGMVKRCYKTD